MQTNLAQSDEFALIGESLFLYHVAFFRAVSIDNVDFKNYLHTCFINVNFRAFSGLIIGSQIKFGLEPNWSLHFQVRA